LPLEKLTASPRQGGRFFGEDVCETDSMSRRRIDTYVLGCVVLLLALGVWFGRPKDAKVVGQTVPLSSLLAVANADGELSVGVAEGGASVPGKVTVLEFFASWCPSCKKQLPRLETTATARDTHWVSVSLDSTPSLAAAAAKSWGLVRPVAMDTSGELPRFLGIQVLPTTVVIGADGQVVDFVAGSISEARLAEAVRKARSR
jgi:cytochrome c biogenesis protein CcmG, thiol:disulfide interchange protein DsbE